MNLLWLAYALIALSFLAALILLLRGRRRLALRAAMIGTFGVLLALLLYWFLAPE